MNLFPSEILRQLRFNGKSSAFHQIANLPEPDHNPVVKIFDPSGGATWLLTESMPDEPNMLFGLCDLGMGFPELGYVLRSDLESDRGDYGLSLERDLHFVAYAGISTYVQAANEFRRIVETCGQLGFDTQLTLVPS